MSKLTFKVSVDNVAQYLNRLAEEITATIALDKDVILQNDMMESGYAIGIENWDTVRETIGDALRLWTNALMNKTALPIPCPKGIYALLHSLVYRSIEDQRGTVRFKLEITPSFLPSSVDIGAQNALFGSDGYFNRMGSLYNGDDYMVGGKPVSPTLKLGKENNLITSKKTVSMKEKKMDVGKIPVQVSEMADNVVVGIDGHDIDTTGHYLLLPPVDLVENGHKELLAGRIVQMAMPFDEFAYTSMADRAGLAALWAMSNGDIPCAVRNVLTYDLNTSMRSDVQRSILRAEDLSPTSDLPNNISRSIVAVDSVAIGHVIDACAGVMNPNTLRSVVGKLSTTDDFEVVHTLAQIVPKAIGTVVQSESLRATKFRFLTFNSPTGGFTGFTLACLNAKSLEKIQVGQLETGILAMRTLLGAYSVIRSAPLVSVDNNRVPITIKYSLLVPSEDKDDNTGLAEHTRRYQQPSAQAVVNVIQKAMVIEVVGPDKVTIDQQSVAGVLRFLADAKESAYTNSDKLATEIVGELEKYQTVDLEVNVVTNKHLLETLRGESFWTTMLNDKELALYSFTKLKEMPLISNSEKLAYCFHYPVYRSSERHCLVVNGYVQNVRHRVTPEETVSTANLINKDTGSAITEHGKVITVLMQKGGFGFGSILGTLAGQLGGIAGDIFGVPEIGQIAGTLGNVGGGLIDAFL